MALEQAAHGGVVGEASELGVDAQLFEEDPRGEEVDEHGEGHHEDEDALDDRLVRLRRGVEHAEQVGLVDEDGDGQHEEDHPVEERDGRARDVAHDDELGHHLHPVDDVHARAVARVAAVLVRVKVRVRIRVSVGVGVRVRVRVNVRVTISNWVSAPGAKTRRPSLRLRPQPWMMHVMTARSTIMPGSG